MRVSVVHNRKAGGGNTSRRQLETLLEEFGHKVQHYVGKKDDWGPLLSDPGEMIVVAGGDGTVGAVARSLVRRDVPIAVLPLGTANNIAGALGISGLTREVVASWRAAQPRAIDLGIAIGPWGKSWFVEGFGLGLMATGMAQLRAHDKLGNKQRRDLAFKLYRARLALGALVGQYPPMALTGSLDGEQLSGEFLLLQAMNMPSVGPGLALASRADPADGKLDFVLLSTDRRAAFADALTALREHGKATLPVEVRRGCVLKLAGNGYDAHIDDRTHRPEPAPAEAPLDIEVRIDAQAVQILLPSAA